MMKRKHRTQVLSTTLRLLCSAAFGAAAMVLRPTVKSVTATVGSSRLAKNRSGRQHHPLSLVLQQPLHPCRSGLCSHRLPGQATSNSGILLGPWLVRWSCSLSREGGVAVLAASTSASATGSSSAVATERFVTVRGETETEETIKKSRFIGRCGPVATFEEAKALLERVLKEHPKARHSCWAWKGLGNDRRFSDDGEPGGTAGQPILGAIESEGLSDVMVVVTRYFGGIKLGTGGLCRAYAGAARLCLQAAARETRTPVLQLSVTAPVGYLGGVYHAVSECQRLSEEFTADGGVALRIAVELGQVDEVRRRLQDATKGAAAIVEVNKKTDD